MCLWCVHFRHSVFRQNVLCKNPKWIPNRKFNAGSYVQCCEFSTFLSKKLAKKPEKLQQPLLDYFACKTQKQYKAHSGIKFWSIFVQHILVTSSIKYFSDFFGVDLFWNRILFLIYFSSADLLRNCFSDIFSIHIKCYILLARC